MVNGVYDCREEGTTIFGESEKKIEDLNGEQL